MRDLKEDEMKLVRDKISKFIGNDFDTLLKRTDNEYSFQLHKGRVYYCSIDLLKRAGVIPRSCLISFGRCIGKMTKSGKFHLNITALDLISPYAKNKLWLKDGSDMQFLYGNNPLRSSISKITENTPKYGGVVVYSKNDLPLGFGLSSKSTLEFRSTDPLTVACYRQADIGEYLRNEEML
ncbi:hypothetical protein GJ496_010090 [Pomphorhynchus laevis]|nr:hypothetical protein GJ496_010090 [Pomphorhynchus laevis]